MRSLLAAAFLALAAAAPPPGATNCSGCHHAGSGLAAINGRDAAGLAATMTAYRSGTLPSTVMGRLMMGLTPAEIQAIAEWVTAQR